MRRSANLSAEKLVLDYLGRVSSVAQRILPKGDRLLFVGRTRALIEKRCGPLATAQPAKVLEVIAELGDPATMVKNELERLETAHRGGGPPTPVVLWKPAKDDTEPIPRQPAPPPGAPGPSAPSSPGSALPSEALPSEVLPSEVLPSGALPSEVLPSEVLPSGVQDADQADDSPAPAAAPVASPASIQALARSHPLETVAVLVLGVGGLIIPPLWLAGGLVALVSRVWDARDKWLALLGPLIFVLAALLAASALVGGRHGFFGEFLHAFDAYREYLIRAGVALTAVYLAWRIRRGPRMRSLPPWQRPRRGPAS